MALKTWVVRAGRGAVRMDEFLENNVVGVGWDLLPDLSGYSDRKQVLNLVKESWPEWKPGKQAASAGQLYRFAHEITKGDRVLTYDPQKRIYNVASVEGEYRYQQGKIEGFPHLLPVTWVGEVERDRLSTSAKNSLGAISTLFLVPEKVADEIDAILTGKKPVLPDPDKADETDDEQILEDVEAKALEFIKDRVSQLDWEEMQELVAGILRAMGYKTRVSANGPDRGKDIVASPDGFGFESPRIVVEVKHRGGAMGSSAIRSFLGGRHPDDKGLYVSTGGFSKDAYYEAERANIPLTLMTLDELVLALLEHYEDLDIDTKQMVPLKRLYWPI
ncbi:MAG: restriction endonuclease [Candidatus Thiodiazotropha taylori]|nr:restriction endonuclease [Candidatus Thiodiazotropha taylori]